MKNSIDKFNVLFITLCTFVCALVAILPGTQIAYAVETITYYHHDALGSPVAATDEAGNLKWREDYQPYGERIRKPTNATENNLWYTGKPEEPELGLQYFGARWYDPQLGRFTGIDPVGVNEGNIHSFNRYAYANNNPYRYIDPNGEDAWEVIVQLYQYDKWVRDHTRFTAIGFMHPLNQIEDAFDSGVGLVNDANACAGGSGFSCAAVGGGIILEVGTRGKGKAVKEGIEDVATFAKNVKLLQNAKGKGNDINVKTQREAEALIEEARPDIPWNLTYEKPKTKIGKEIHPSDGGGQNLPHIKWKDWSKGKSEGAEGHIYFESP